MDQDNQESVAMESKRRNEFNVIKTRIDPEDLLSRIEYYLRGARYVTQQNENGELKPVKMSFGLAKANELGVQSILSWLSMIINPHTVQGNFQTDRTGFCKQHSDYVFFWRVNFGVYLMNNLNKFEIEIEEYQGIIDSIGDLIDPFMTRLIDNLERISYGETIQTRESNTVRSKGVGLFNEGG